MRQQHPTSGTRKLRARLQRIDAGQCWQLRVPFTERLQQRVWLAFGEASNRALYRAACSSNKPNEVWSMDFKGSFECGNGERCNTFTVTNAFSRFVLHCQAIEGLNHQEVDRVCDELMKKYGVPERIRTDNGTPFSFDQRVRNQ
jgi:transposase InsO family protein